MPEAKMHDCSDKPDQTGKCADIINLPHYKSKRRPQMPKSSRAAQFMPFSALSGYKESIDNAREDFQRDY